MGLKCKVFGCGDDPKNFDYYNGNEKKCKKCGNETIYMVFYPNRDASWIDKKFVDRWGSYENLVAVKRVCECCGRVEDNNGECGCNAC